MKRFVFAAALMAMLLIFNFYCLSTVKTARDELLAELDFLQYAASTKEPEETALECRKFAENWFLKEHILRLIIRHEALDRASASISRFEPFAKFGEYAELSAEINSCKTIINEMYDSEVPFLRNIL